MSQQTWTELLNTEIADGPTLTAAAEALLVPDFTFGAKFMKVERAVRATIYGRASNAVTTPGTIQFRVRWGGLAGLLLCDSGALTQNVIVQTNKTFFLQFLIVCRAVGNGTLGSLFCIGHGQRGNQAAAVVADMVPDLYPPSAPAAVGVDTTTAKALSITATPSLGTASITAHHYIVEATN